jgi:uncharacterized protein (DUF983 family)
MNKKGQHYHAHYTGDIPFGIWVLLVAIACIGLGWLIPELSVLGIIGWVLFILWIGAIIISIIQQ